MSKRERIEQLSIYLLKPTIGQWQQALRAKASYTTVALPPNTLPGATLIVRSTPPHAPRWLRYLPPQTQAGASQILSASAGAVLFVPHGTRLFATCFGTGWHLLSPDSFVRNFGLKTALSIAKNGTLKSVDVSTYENMAKHRRVSTSRGATIDAFDVEGSLDLLRGVVGECGLPVGKHIGGKDSCVVWTRVKVDDLNKLCRTLLRVYESGRVARRYPLLDNISEVRDPVEIQRLDNELDAVLSSNPNHDISIAPPEVVDWQSTSAFVIEHPNAPNPALQYDFTQVRQLFPSSPTTTDLKAIGFKSQTPAGDDGMGSWKLYDCLVTEIDDPSDPTKKCILMAGDWYLVSASLVGQVNQDIRAIPVHATSLPNAAANENEGAYNKRLAASNPARYTCLDAKLISYGGGRSRIEVCDVLSSNSVLYHIKDYSGSATLSHLFAQGTVSSRLLLEQDFRTELLRKYPSLPRNVVQASAVTPANLEIVYGIICESSRSLPGGLPFFAKVRLIEARKELQRMGFTNVSIAKITRP
jgi:uncharacterized protein (TIGR04141 family)